MKLITSRCPTCNALVEFPDYHETVKCEYCGSQIRIEDSVRKNADALHKLSREIVHDKFHQEMEAARVLESLERLDEAQRKYKAIVDRYPDRSEAWMGLCRTTYFDDGTADYYLRQIARDENTWAMRYGDLNAYTAALHTEQDPVKRRSYEEEYQNYWRSIFDEWITKPKRFLIDPYNPTLQNLKEYITLLERGKKNAEEINKSLPIIPQYKRESDFKGLFSKSQYNKYNKNRLQLIEQRHIIIQSLIREDLQKDKNYQRQKLFGAWVLTSNIFVSFALGNTLIIEMHPTNDPLDNMTFRCTPSRIYN